MKILIIGGTYFLGKAFLELADQAGDQITVINRGNKKIPGNEDGHILELRADRQRDEAVAAICERLRASDFDCVVDFCAYEAGDVQRIMNVLPPGVKQYVFISTCDVYRRGTGLTLSEDSTLEDRDFGGEAGAYILGKVALEKELARVSAERGVHFTSIRPAFIYGPGNYAPREGVFFEWVSKAGQILFPEDADGSFQMVYVKDLAKCIYACLLREEAFDHAFNACGESLTYQSFAEALEKATGQRIERVNLTVSDVNERGIPLPFPLTREESECYDGTAVLRLGVSFTPFEAGLKETYDWFCQAKG